MTSLFMLGVACILLAFAGIARLIEKRTDHIMTALTNVQANEADLIAKTDALLAFAGSQIALIADLQAKLAEAGNADPALQTIADQLAAESAKVAAFLAPPVPPAPVV